jgi:hyperosmotically inducible periplasmic protein
MYTQHRLLCALLMGAAMACSVSLFAQNSNAQQPTASQDADNTRVNQRDRNDTLKPTDQPNDKADIQTAAAVRKAIENDKSLSMNAHNVKLIARNGVVTLRGPVADAQEKSKIEQIATNVSGVSRVENNLDVKTDTKKE